MKESLKRITKWAAKYCTHERSYYLVHDTSLPLSALSTMFLPAVVQSVTKEDEVVMRDWLENFRPVRQRTVRSETTKDEAGSLPPVVYSKSKQKEHSYVEFNKEPTPPDNTPTPAPITETTEQSGQPEHSPANDELPEVSLTFVSDLDVPEVQVQDIQHLDEYKTDSDTGSDEGDFTTYLYLQRNWLIAIAYLRNFYLIFFSFFISIFDHASLKNYISAVIYSSIYSYTSLERAKTKLSGKKYFGLRKPIIFHQKKLTRHISA